MADRIIFRLKHDGETLAYLYQNWGMGDGEEDRLLYGERRAQLRRNGKDFP